YIATFTNLRIISVFDNDFTSFPDLSGLLNLTDILIEDNMLTLEDIIPNLGVASSAFTYAPQQNAGKEKNILVPQGTDYTIDLRFDEGVAGSSYDWFLEGSFIGNTIVPTFDIFDFQADEEGTYTVQITNSTAPDLTLNTNDIHLAISNVCTSFALNVENSRLERVIFNDLDNITNTDPLECTTYTNFTDLSTDVVVGQLVDVGFQIGTCDGEVDKGVKMYVDWDQDGAFNEIEEFIASGGILPDSIATQFYFGEAFYQIPDVPAGNYVLRVVVMEATDLAEITGCGSYDYGETEDYTINVITPLPDLEVAITDITPVSMFDQFTPITGGDQMVVSVTVSNLGTAGSVATANGVGFYASSDLIWDSGDELLTMVSINAINAGSFENLPGNMVTAPNMPGSFFLIAVVDPLDEIIEDDEDFNTDITDEIFVESGDTESPVITLLSPASSYELGTGGVTIQASITDNVGISTVGFAFAKITQVTDDFDAGQYTVVIPDEVSAGVFAHTFTDSDFDAIGVQYFFAVSDAVGNVGSSSPFPAKISTVFGSGALRISGVTPVASSTNPVETDYRLFSVPVRNATISSVFGVSGVDDEKFRVWQYTSGQNSELRSTSSGLAAGKGFWLIYLSGEVDLNFGGPAVQASNSSPFTMTLRSGLNLIGNPYNFAISWQAVIDHNIAKGTITSGDISGLTFYTGSFQNRGNTTLGKTEGAFVQSNEPFTIEIPFSAQTARLATRARTRTRPLDAETWEVPIDLEIAATGYEVAAVGMRPDAKDGRDKYDLLAMPYLNDYLEFNSLNPAFTERISKDFVTTTPGHVWEFEAVTSYAPGRAALRWDNSYFGDNAIELMLYDVAGEKVVNMREATEYHFHLSESRRFRIYYGDEAWLKENLQPAGITLGYAYPNPFTEKVVIPFTLPSGNGIYTVKATVYNAMGQQVRTLLDRRMESGFHTISWGGDNDAGVRMREGMYYYKLSVSHENGRKDLTGKIIFRN
ncbi:MAG: hypothetical protein IIB82_17705, partial [Bacteroidetes bacterium]|nr:hypothetical protein [Bacteroidota bacterium]